MKSDLGVIILAAGKGTRMKSKKINKVALPIADKPMIVHTIELLEKMGIKKIVVVVGFARNSVMNVLGQKVLFAIQEKRLGTAHALSRGLRVLPNGTKNILVLNGDDSAFYTKDLIKNLINKHIASKADFTLLTIEKDNPTGLGRVVKDSEGRVQAVIEDKDATEEQKKIKEINPGCYIFKVDFLNKYLAMVKKSPITNEYYLTSLIDIGIKNKQKVEALFAGKILWRGVNTGEELKEAEILFRNAN